MKYLLLLLLMPTLTFSQGQIEGLGKFKIGKTTTSIVDEVARELKCKVARVTMDAEVDEFGLLAPSVVELAKDDKLPVDPPKNISPCPGSRTFYISKYNIADMEVIGIYLIFNEDRLVKILCQADGKLNEALEFKYGKVPIDLQKDTVKCYSALTGGASLLEQQRAIRQWNSGTIQAINRVMWLYNKNCKPRESSDLSIYDTTLMQAMLLCESKQKAAVDADRKSKLKDF